MTITQFPGCMILYHHYLLDIRAVHPHTECNSGNNQSQVLIDLLKRIQYTSFNIWISHTGKHVHHMKPRHITYQGHLEALQTLYQDFDGNICTDLQSVYDQQ